MVANGSLLLIGDLYFVEQQWQNLKEIDGIAQLKVGLSMTVQCNV